MIWQKFALLRQRAAWDVVLSLLKMIDFLAFKFKKQILIEIVFVSTSLKSIRAFKILKYLVTILKKRLTSRLLLFPANEN